MVKKGIATKKAKEPIRIRFKTLENGSQSIYFDIYRDGVRKYEFPKLYLVPETSDIEKQKNIKTLELANKIKAKMILELDNKEHGFSYGNNERKKETITSYINELADKKKNEGAMSMYYSFTSLSKHLEKYKAKATFKQVNREYCRGFIEYLKMAQNEKSKGNLTAGSQSGYSRLLTVALNTAVQDEYIMSNPMKQLKRNEIPKAPASNREYLTIDEIKKLEKTDCKKETVKRAFLFTCFCGLRYSDVEALKWGDIQTDNEGKKIIKYRQKKTKKSEYLQVSDEALKQLPEQKEAKEDDKIFQLSQNGYINQTLVGWGMAAGIGKKITFHVARHTHATLLLSLGVAIETVSKLLGHSDIKTTQIYAKVIDKSKREAVSKLDELLKENL